MKNKDTKLLASVKDGETVKIVSIAAGCTLNSRLRAMGILPGVEIIVVNNRKAGAFVVKVKEAKMVLGRGIANKIMVS
jgi:Fe2+ transport system protein FeoA